MTFGDAASAVALGKDDKDWNWVPRPLEEWVGDAKGMAERDPHILPGGGGCVGAAGNHMVGGGSHCKAQVKAESIAGAGGESCQGEVCGYVELK